MCLKINNSEIWWFRAVNTTFSHQQPYSSHHWPKIFSQSRCNNTVLYHWMLMSLNGGAMIIICTFFFLKSSPAWEKKKSSMFFYGIFCAVHNSWNKILIWFAISNLFSSPSKTLELWVLYYAIFPALNPFTTTDKIPKIPHRGWKKLYLIPYFLL